MFVLQSKSDPRLNSLITHRTIRFVKKEKNGRVMRDFIGTLTKISIKKFLFKNKPFVMQVHFLTAHYISKMNSRS